MQRVGSRIVISPSDLNHFLECEYLTRLDVDVADGHVLPMARSPEADLLAAKGDAHEGVYLARFRADDRNVAVIEDPSRVGWSLASRATRDAMAAGADVIYQAVLLDDGWRGRADFLVRVDSGSDLGEWSYEAWDTKLARHVKPSHILQLAYYSNGIASIQGREPASMRVVLGTGEIACFAVRDFAAYFRAVRGRFEQALSERAAADPYPVSHCRFCGYLKHCEEWWRSRDHLSQIAAIRRSQVERLEQAGVRTCAELGTTSQLQVAIDDSALQRLRQQARLQSEYRITGAHRYELLPVTQENGFSLLPPPSQGDVFFDMEGFPFFDPSRGLEYLFGVVTADSGEVSFRPFWATDRAGEKRGFEQFVDFLWERLGRWPDLHVYHYAHYEPTALKRLMSEHATREEELDELLRREVFVDLFQVVRRSMRISHDTYSLKAVRQFFMPDAGKGEVTGGGESIVQFQRWLDTGEQRILDAIERYNEEDCVSTLRLRDWLLERRTEAEQQFDVDVPFLPLSKQRKEATEIKPDAHAERRARLDALGADWARTVSHLLDYHRREAKPEWWAYFQRRKKSLDELLDDTEAIAHLTAVPGVAPRLDKQSLVYTLEFPAQEFKLKVDSAVEGALGEGRVGSIEWIDASAGRLGLRRGKNRSTEPLPRAIIAGTPIPDKAQREAIVRVADAAVEGLDRYGAVRDILSRRTPRFSSPRPTIQTLVLEEQKRLISDLRDSYLFVQGPPGSGKTWTGARLIVDLMRSGKRVGVTAPSHRAIHNLLDEVEAVAATENVTFVGLKKRSVSDETVFEGRYITSAESNVECENSTAQLVAATAWLFAREEMDQSLDYLFVDEAGQVSLADTVAVGTCARNIVLLGDPRQLPHVTQNSHPEGAGVSVLEHLLGDAATVPTDRGIFLAQSWRMHPDVCHFVADHSYDGRLSSAAGCEHQAIASTGLAGAGLRHILVDHRHNAQQSAEEAEAIAREVRTLLQTGRVTDAAGVTRALTSADILVVTPYNMQVRCLREALPAGIEVGTVDKFQGREAPVVFFSMSSSTGDDVPRGLEFLFNRNRFNVAISRAKCLAVVVCSPRLLEAQCRTVGQMRLVNGLCVFTEQAMSLALPLTAS